MAGIGYVLIVLGIFCTDLRIKDRIEKGIGEDGRERVQEEGAGRIPESLFGNRILIRKYHNRGAMLNLGCRHRPVVAAVSVAMCLLAALVFLGSLGRRGNVFLRAGLALLLGGAFSNTYDRLRRRYVVDYFSFNVKWKRLQNIVFNISDFCIMIGALVIVYTFAFPSEK